MNSKGASLPKKGVLERLLAIVQFLAQNNMAFRGTEERLNAPNNGNFLGLVQLVAKFDPVLQEHAFDGSVMIKFTIIT